MTTEFKPFSIRVKSPEFAEYLYCLMLIDIKDIQAEDAELNTVMKENYASDIVATYPNAGLEFLEKHKERLQSSIEDTLKLIQDKSTECVGFIQHVPVTAPEQLDGKEVFCAKKGVTVGCVEVSIEELEKILEKCKGSKM